MAGRQLRGQGVTTRTNYMALVAIFVLALAVGCAGFSFYYKDFYGLAASGVIAIAGVGCALLALGDDGS